MARIAIIDHGDGTYQINLTNSRDAWARRHFTDPRPALAYVTDLQAHGHKICFPTALADLRDDAKSATTGPMAAD
jgi:hypothetical protein